MSKLVKTSYFVSPEYTARFDLGNIYFDQQDLEPAKTIQEALINHREHPPLTTEFVGKFMGENGVFCEAIGMHVGNNYQRYRFVVRIQSQPANRGLPSELSDLLRENKFEERAGEDYFVDSARRRLR